MNAPLEIVREKREVRGDLAMQLALRAPAAEETLEPRKKSPIRLHG